MMRRRTLHLGAGAGLAYLLLAVVSFTYGSLPTLPLYDGVSLEPYRFVKPPKPLAEFNRKPYSFRQRLPLGPDGFSAATVATIDNHAILVLPDGSVEPAVGETEIVVAIDPLGPATLGSPPPKADYDGNAYRFTARYAASGKPVRLRTGCPADAAPGSSSRCMTVIVRYAFGPVVGRGGDTRLYRRSGDRWVAVPTKNIPSLFQAYASSGDLGTFVAAGANRPTAANRTMFPARLGAILAAGGLLAGLLLHATHSSRAKRQRDIDLALDLNAGRERPSPSRTPIARPRHG
jgi:hypothetical protein